jgi:hypothetical protein
MLYQFVWKNTLHKIYISSLIKGLSASLLSLRSIILNRYLISIYFTRELHIADFFVVKIKGLNGFVKTVEIEI